MNIDSFTASWQGVVLGIVGIIAFVILVPTIIKNLNALKGLKIGKGGITFGTTDDMLGKEIPAIDQVFKLKALHVTDGLLEVARTWMQLHHEKWEAVAPSEYKTCIERMLRMILSSKLLRPLYTAIDRNHLATNLCARNIEGWMAKVQDEIELDVRIIADYCNLPIDIDDVHAQSRVFILTFWVPQIKALVVECVQKKLAVYSQLEMDNPRREGLIRKCNVYLEDLSRG